jgi:hypothetical protein
MPGILGVELPYSNAQNEQITFTNTQNIISVRGLKRNGFTYHRQYNILLPSSFVIDHYKSLAKQFVGVKDNIYVKVHKGGALPL